MDKKSDIIIRSIFRPLGERRGIGILVLVVIIGFTTLLALGGTMAQSEHSLRRFKMVRTKKSDSLALKYEINFVMSACSGCIENLKTVAVSSATTASNPVQLSSIVYGDVSPNPIGPLISLASPQLALYGRVPVKRISLYAHPTKFGVDGIGTHLTLLELEIGKAQESADMNDKLFPFRRLIGIPVYVSTDAAGNIQSCHSTNYSMKDAAGEDITLEEKLCADAPAGSRTANWPGDCISCLNSDSAYYLCMDCKKAGKVYDATVKACI